MREQGPETALTIENAIEDVENIQKENDANKPSKFIKLDTVKSINSNKEVTGYRVDSLFDDGSKKSQGHD